MRLFAQTDFTLLERELIYFIHQKTFIEVILFSLNEGGDPLFFFVTFNSHETRYPSSTYTNYPLTSIELGDMNTNPHSDSCSNTRLITSSISHYTNRIIADVNIN